jgi:hypothetical protein
MAAPHSVDPAEMLEQHLVSASPDLLREMIASFANAMMSAQADQSVALVTASPASSGSIGVTATGCGSGTPALARWSWRCPSCGRACLPGLVTDSSPTRRAGPGHGGRDCLPAGVSTRRVERLAEQLGIKSLSRSH